MIETKSIHKLLVRGTNWVGDAVLSLPALFLIRQSLPQAHITLMVVPWVSGVYEECPAINEIFLYNRRQEHRGVRGKFRLVEELHSKQFDAAILFQNAFEAALLAGLSRIPLRAGYRRDGRGWLLSPAIRRDPRLKNLHQSYYYLDLVEQIFGLQRSLESPSPCGPENSIGSSNRDWLSVSPPRRQKARQTLESEGIRGGRPIIGVNPGASFGSAKRWPTDRFASLLDRLAGEQEVNVVLCGSPAEVPIARAIASRMRHAPTILSGKTSLAELVAVISCCDLFITNDSGPMHLAAALKIPMVSIFGPTDEIATGPMNSDAVLIKKRVECSPCLLRECPIDHRCMTRIAVDEVYRQAVQQLQKISA
ncbi:MAG: lipopolysaccharide heptosyltransferase II [Terriglobia bacterium]